MILFDKWALVVGAGKSGTAAAALLLRQGRKVILYDGNRDLSPEALRGEVLEECRSLDRQELAMGLMPGELNGQEERMAGNLRIQLGTFPEDASDITQVILSPGVPAELPEIVRLAQEDIPVWGEVELAYSASRGRIAAITGTNGKTTTTALAGEIMKDYYPSVFVVGNIGIPFTSTAPLTREDSVTVAEISSFQLETIHDFKPDVSAILNITPDHLNRHHTMENYIAAKESITKNQGEGDACVLNYEDEVLREFGRNLPLKVWWFSGAGEIPEGLWYDGTAIFIRQGAHREKVCDVSELNLLGRHNYENVMAAVAIGLEMGVPMESIRKTLRRFQAVEHRIEFVAEIDGVAYYNDSKGTNPDAAIKGIQAMNRPTWLIGGGYDKGSSYEEWIKSFDGKVRELVLIGQTKEKIKEAALRCGFGAVHLCETLEEAVSYCRRQAKAGEAVLLSPACASWGMFKNYEERGRIFKELVKQG